MHKALEVSALGVELLAVAIIVVAVGYGTFRFVSQMPRDAAAYRRYKSHLAKALLLGLELLVAADIVRTVGIEPSLNAVAVLGLLIVVRTFLSWSLGVEIEGRWPWKAGAAGRDTSESR
jgi:uncharacterized membrane protein